MKKKVFISQPMLGKTNQEIEQQRQEIKLLLEEEYGDTFEVIDSFFKDAPHEAKPLWFLGKSIELLSNADICIFAKGWAFAKGCKIEHACCEEYGIEIIEL